MQAFLFLSAEKVTMNDVPEQFDSAEDDGSPQAVVNPEKAIERLGGSRSLYANVVGRFLDDTSGNFALLRQAVRAGDLSQIKRTAHSVKGLAAMCGAISVQDALAALEVADNQDKDVSMTALLSRVDAELSEARKVLQPFRAETSLR
jgi:HPt (histidine-containing phosphotransfer) domain-containing protein